MSTAPLALLVPAVALACAAPLQVRPREAAALHPLAVAPEAPARALAGDLPGPRDGSAEGGTGGSGAAGGAGRGTAEGAGDGAGGPGTAAGSGAGSAAGSGAGSGAGSARDGAAAPRLALSATVTTPSIVPAGGQARADLVASAVALLGLRTSFQERSFLGHLLRVNDLLPPGAVAASYGAPEALAAARAGRLLRDAGEARPGDLAFFACPGDCGTGTRDGAPTAGVVETAEGGAARWVCFVDGEVRRCSAAGGGGALRAGDPLGVADPWSLRAAAGGGGVSPAAR